MADATIDPGGARTLTASFEVTGWDESPYLEPADGPKLTRATVRKRFCGAIEGESVAELLTAQGPGGRRDVASEHFVGSIEGRSGSAVFQHGGLDDGRKPLTYGAIVPGSGTGPLAALEGRSPTSTTSTAPG